MNHPAHDKLIAIAKGWQMERSVEDEWVPVRHGDAALDWARAAGWHRIRIALAQPEVVEPIDMVLHCPACGMQHIDKPEGQFYPGHTAQESVDVNKYYGMWSNPPHRSHLCHGCGHTWRPADVPTNGVAAVKTKGKADSPIVAPTTHAAAAGKDGGDG